MHDESSVRSASAADAKVLAELSNRWTHDQLKSLTNGFLLRAFDETDFSKLIADDCVVVLVVKGNVVGYQLVNTLPDWVAKYESVVDALRSRQAISGQERIGIGVQILIDLPHQGRGHSRKLLRELLNLVDRRFDILISTVHKSNERSLWTHLASGWLVVNTAGERVVIIRRTN